MPGEEPQHKKRLKSAWKKGSDRPTPKIKKKKLQAVTSHSSSCPQAKSPQGKEQL